MSIAPEDVRFGIETFGDLPLHDSGEPMSHAASLRQVVAEAALADQIGIDAVALGEHHRSDFAISSPRWCWRRSRPAPNASHSVRP
ncbi:hypothetical protein GCM10025876_05440 [Demequina litorisediminis]|uniref:Luciferase-like monooxygenase n=1 Tax=Demequina litorisediminis TaxID=1849022 RepID=A0ABQ6I9C4_9MICO|nr:hypothetical protein GCM10025876_05440 [Demequina litorisediminis]